MKTDLLAPNSEDENGKFWDPWEALGIGYGGYSSQVDQDGIAVLRAIRDRNNSTDIAKATGLADNHVELWQYIFCSARWCDYGTSPRSCWPDFDIDFDGLIAAWEAYYERHWGENPLGRSTPNPSIND